MLNEKISITKKELAIIITILFFGLILSIYLASFVNNSKNSKLEKSLSFNEVLSKVGNNYSIVVKKNENDVVSEINVACDEEICLYSGDGLKYLEIIKYKDKYFSLSDFDNIDNAELVKVNDTNIDDIFNNRYYDLNLVKSLVEISKKVDNEDNLINTEFSLERFLKEYNYLYDEINKTDSDINVSMIIKTGISNIRSISIDYKDVDSYFNNTSYEKLTYDIEFKNFNNNNFDDFKDILDIIN